MDLNQIDAQDIINNLSEQIKNMAVALALRDAQIKKLQIQIESQTEEKENP